LKEGGMIIINSYKNLEDLKFPDKYKVVTVNATGIAVKHKLGTLAAPIVNTSIVGAVVKLLKLTKLESVLEAVREGVPTKPEENAAAAKEAYEKA
jgi:Pyruvate/2-oxoacid:ferredoxin oxidoreductase gamma subunit